MKLIDDVKAVREWMDGEDVEYPQKELVHLLNACEEMNKILNQIAMLGCSEHAYSKEFTERVNQLVREVLEKL